MTTWCSKTQRVGFLAINADLACATWNIHRAKGADGRVDPGRVLRAILDEPRLAGADALVLTEADGERAPHPGLLDLDRLAGTAGLVPAGGRAAAWGTESHGFLGTLVLVRAGTPVGRVSVIDLPGVYPRGAVVADLACVRLVAAHLSLGQPLRIAQMRGIAQHLARLPALPVILLGDLNEWRPWGGMALSQRVAGRRLTGPALATFPARWPVLPLDRILSEQTVAGAEVLDTPAFRAASDHLPLVARVGV